MIASIFKSFQAAKFLFVGPLILAFLVAVNLMTSPGHWWVQWAALGIGIAWVVSLIRVLRALVVIGGIGALIAYLRRKYSPK